MEFQKIQLLFSNFKKQFLNFYLKSVEYSDTPEIINLAWGQMFKQFSI